MFGVDSWVKVLLGAKDGSFKWLITDDLYSNGVREPITAQSEAIHTNAFCIA